MGGDLLLGFKKVGSLQLQFSLVCGTSVGDVLLLDSNFITLADSEGRFLLATSNT